MADTAVKNESEDVVMEDIQEAVPSLKGEVKLEDIFDDESDEEFPSSRPVDSQPDTTFAGDILDMKASDPEIMRTFYQRLFPWRLLFRWLNHDVSPKTDFQNREFAFTLQNDAYLRYQVFPSHDALRKNVLRLMPSRFEIGPVYSISPRDRKTNPSAFRPISKELCFDIDLTDYDEIRTCCDKANICAKCWSFMTMAIKTIDVALRNDFGFKHIMWVYSGRRGAHAWVCDKNAREMDDAKRRAVAGYLEVIKGGARTGKKVNPWRPLHPHLSRSLEILKSHFQEDVLAVQNPWQSAEQAEKLLKLLPDPTLNDSLRRKWNAAPERSSVAKWGDIDAVARTGGASKKLNTKGLLEAKQDIVLEYTYPRLDIEVSKKLNHLLKSPFVVHPGTGRVCVPIDTKNDLDRFDPLAVPTVQQLIKEIDDWQEEEKEVKDCDSGSGKKVVDWEKTSIRPHIDFFRRFVDGMMREEVADSKVKREVKREMEF